MKNEPVVMTVLEEEGMIFCLRVVRGSEHLILTRCLLCELTT